MRGVERLSRFGIPDTSKSQRVVRNGGFDAFSRSTARSAHWSRPSTLAVMRSISPSRTTIPPSMSTMSDSTRRRGHRRAARARARAVHAKGFSDARALVTRPLGRRAAGRPVAGPRTRVRRGAYRFSSRAVRGSVAPRDGASVRAASRFNASASQSPRVSRSTTRSSRTRASSVPHRRFGCHSVARRSSVGNPQRVNRTTASPSRVERVAAAKALVSSSVEPWRVVAWKTAKVRPLRRASSCVSLRDGEHAAWLDVGVALSLRRPNRGVSGYLIVKLTAPPTRGPFACNANARTRRS